jgi:hypothetical protein
MASVSEDVAKLELFESEASAKRVRRIIIELKNKDLPEFKKMVSGTTE